MTDAETTADGRMGFTEAKPVVVDMNGGCTLGTFPAVILPGGYNEPEVHGHSTEASVLDCKGARARRSTS